MQLPPWKRLFLLIWAQLSSRKGSPPFSQPPPTNTEPASPGPWISIKKMNLYIRNPAQGQCNESQRRNSTKHLRIPIPGTSNNASCSLVLSSTTHKCGHAELLSHTMLTEQSVFFSFLANTIQPVLWNWASLCFPLLKPQGAEGLRLYQEIFLGKPHKSVSYPQGPGLGADWGWNS